MTSAANAMDDMLSMFTAAWMPRELYYENIPEDRLKTEDPFARIMVRHASGVQRTLGEVGHRMFNRSGVVVVTIYAPQEKGLSESIELAKVAVDAYEGKSSPNGVWFRNVRMNEVGRSGNFRLTNVLADFTYDETK